MDYKRVLRLHYVNGYSSRTIGKQTYDGKSTVAEFLKRFEACEELSWPLPEEVTNEYIENLLYKKKGNTANNDYYRDFNEEEVHRKLAKKGETLLHLWKLYNAEGEVDGKRPLSYRQFCRRYSNWLGSKNVTFHIQRYPGVNLELDFAGKTLVLHDIHDPTALTDVTIFVATLSFSDMFYVEGMTCCDIANWIRVNNNALAYFGGATQTVTPDNCKVAVTKNKDWIDPSLNKDFQAWAEHNGTVVLPAKVQKPRWKPNVEGHVKIVTMHILVEISRKNMSIHIRHGKNRSDRYAILSQLALDALTEYWKVYHKPMGYLFPNPRNPEKPMASFWVSRHIHLQEEKLGWPERLTPHSFRHAFGTHLYEQGVELPVIQTLLGHKSLNSTMIYVHLASPAKNRFVNPLDALMAKHDKDSGNL